MMKGYLESRFKFASIQKCDRFIFIESITKHGHDISLEDGYSAYFSPNEDDVTLGAALIEALKGSHSVDYKINPGFLDPNELWRKHKKEHTNHCKQYGVKSVSRVYRTMESFQAKQFDGHIHITRNITDNSLALPKKDRLAEIVIGDKATAKELGAALREAFDRC